MTSPLSEEELLRVWRFLSRLGQRTVVRSFLIALLATLAVWGWGLSSTRTLSPEAQVWTLRPTCRTAGDDLACAAKFEEVRSPDAGSPSWVNSPTSYFLHHARARGEPRPQWNPYTGSGYPLALDGHSAPFSPSEWLLSHLPGEQGQDIVIFLRFLSWTFALVWAIALFEKNAVLLTAMAFVATLAPYGATYIHIAFLDVDLLGPWFLLLLTLLSTNRIQTRGALLWSLALGLLVGVMAFVQAQVVLVVAMGVLAALAAFTLGARSLLLAATLGLGFLLVIPSWLPLLHNLDQFVTSRRAQCICAQSLGWQSFIDGLVALPLQPAPATITLAGLVLLPWVPRRLWFVPVSVALFGLWIALGSPSGACALPLISGVRFSRHLLPHLQALFLLGTCLAIHRLSRRLDRDRTPFLFLLPTSGLALYVANSAPPDASGLALWASVLLAAIMALIATCLPWAGRWKDRRRAAFALSLMFLVFPPFLLGSPTSTLLLKGKVTAPQAPPKPTLIDPKTPLGKVQQLSREQDRRHFSPHPWVYPNWSQALEILDLRSLNALYPSGIHQLNSALFSKWETDPAHGITPDRFTSPQPVQQSLSVDFQRILALHRVSLFTFTARAALLPGTPGPYQRSRCRRLGVHPMQGAESYICPEVGGVGFFPEIVKVVDTRLQAVKALRRTRPADLLRTALLGPEVDPALRGVPLKPAKGEVISVARSANHLFYWLKVEEPGTFVVADAYFRGWTAKVNGQPTAISRANVAFKAVQVPRGYVDVHLHFKVE